jgi:plastocyanin
LGAIALIALAAPTTAGAAQITAGPGPSSYQNPNVEIDAGEAVTFMNLDLTANHDVTSVDVGAGAQPLFSSATVGFLATVPVEGADALDAGTYEFLCSIHTFMSGSITVRGGGGGGGGGGGDGDDDGAQSLKVTPLEKKLAKVERAGTLPFKVQLGRAATLRISALADGVKFASGKGKLRKGTSRIAAKLTSAGKRLAAKGDPVKLRVRARATDPGGSFGQVSFKLTLR